MERYSDAPGTMGMAAGTRNTVVGVFLRRASGSAYKVKQADARKKRITSLSYHAPRARYAAHPTRPPSPAQKSLADCTLKRTAKPSAPVKAVTS